MTPSDTPSVLGTDNSMSVDIRFDLMLVLFDLKT